MHIPYVYKLINEISKTDEIIIFVDKEFKRDSFKNTKQSNLLIKNQNIDFFSMKNSSIFDRISLQLKELCAYIYYVNRNGVNNFYTIRWRHYLARFLSPVIKLINKSPFIRNHILLPLLIKISPFIFKRRSIKKQLKELNITKVICTSLNLRFSTEEFYAASANSLGIPVFYNVLTWDNLSTKSIFLNRISRVYCWNESQRNQLLKYHKFNNDEIKIVGSLYFEKWRGIQKNFAEEKINKNRSKGRYILYLGSSANIIGKESQIVYTLAHIVQKINVALKNDQKIKIKVKSHPAKQIVLDPFYEIESINNFGLCEDKENELEFAELIRGALCIFGVNTSAMIDSCFISENVFSLTGLAKSRQSDVLHFEEMCDLFNISKLKIGNLSEIELKIKSLLDSSNKFNSINAHQDLLKSSSKLIWRDICLFEKK